MLARSRSHLRSNAIAYVALFFALSGVAYAAGKPVFNGDPAGGDLTGTYPDPLIANGAVTGGTGGKVADDSVTGADVLESSLAEVPSAADADTLDGIDSSALFHIGGAVNADGTIARGSGFSVLKGFGPGGYRVAFPAGTFDGCTPTMVVSPDTGGRTSETEPQGCNPEGDAHVFVTTKALNSDPADSAFSFIAF